LDSVGELRERAKRNPQRAERCCDVQFLSDVAGEIARHRRHSVHAFSPRWWWHVWSAIEHLRRDLAKISGFARFHRALHAIHLLRPRGYIARDPRQRLNDHGGLRENSTWNWKYDAGGTCDFWISSK